MCRGRIGLMLKRQNIAISLSPESINSPAPLRAQFFERFSLLAFEMHGK